MGNNGDSLVNDSLLFIILLRPDDTTKDTNFIIVLDCLYYTLY